MIVRLHSLSTTGLSKSSIEFGARESDKDPMQFPFIIHALFLPILSINVEKMQSNILCSCQLTIPIFHNMVHSHVLAVVLF